MPALGRCLLVGLMLACSSANAAEAIVQNPEYSLVWEHEVSHAVDTPSSGDANTVKSQSILDLELNADVFGLHTTGIVQLKWDQHDDLDDDQDEIDIRELYADLPSGETHWRIGRQQIVWGQSDGLKVLDVVNPQDLREFILPEFDKSRIPLWSVNGELPAGHHGVLTVVWIPDLEFDKLPDPGSRFELTSPLLVPAAPLPATPVLLEPLVEPDNNLENHEIGLRYSTFVNGWDITLNYLYHWHDRPVLYRTVQPDGLHIQPRYRRNHLIGGTLSNAFGDFVLRVEAGINSHTYHLSTSLEHQGISQSEELASVIGLDWQGIPDTLLSFQWFQSYLFRSDENRVRDDLDQTVTFLYRRYFSNETWTVQALAMHSLSNDDGLFRPELSYEAASNFRVWVGADIFYGNHRGLFGQFKDKDQINIGFRWGVF